MDENMVVLKAV
jgi:hypothetical protein